MNRRLQQFLAAENISRSQFADYIGVARASVSHILAGRNKPGFDFIEGMARCYPALNLDWLIMGKGKMYRTDDSTHVLPPSDIPAEPSAQFFGTETPSQIFETEPVKAEPGFSTHKATQPKEVTSDTTSKHGNNQRSISRIVIFFDDNTYQEIK